MTDRDSTTRTRARTPGAEDYPTSTAVHRRNRPDTARDYGACHAMHEGWTQTEREAAYAGSRLKSTSALGRPHLTGQPSSRIGENPPYGMIGGIEETSASFEVRSAPRSYPPVHSINVPSAPRNERTRSRLKDNGRQPTKPPFEPAGLGGLTLRFCYRFDFLANDHNEV